MNNKNNFKNLYLKGLYYLKTYLILIIKYHNFTIILKNEKKNNLYKIIDKNVVEIVRN